MSQRAIPRCWFFCHSSFICRRVTGVETNGKKTFSSDLTALSVLSLPHTHPDHPKHVNYVFNQELGNNIPKKFLVCKCSAFVPLAGNMAPIQY